MTIAAILFFVLLAVYCVNLLRPRTPPERSSVPIDGREPDYTFVHPTQDTAMLDSHSRDPTDCDSHSQQASDCGVHSDTDYAGSCDSGESGGGDAGASDSGSNSD